METTPSTNRKQLAWIERVPGQYWAAGLLLLLMPLIAGDFVLFQIFGWTFILGMIALSLMFLAGYGGMVSLVQMSVAGMAGYMLAIFGDSAVSQVSQGWPWFLAIPMALAIACLFATAVGWLAVRTEGIYTIMITLAIAAAFFYFTRQNYDIFNGFSGFNSVVPPLPFRGELARSGRFLLPYAVLGYDIVSGGALPLPCTFWPCTARCQRRPAPDGSIGVQCNSAPGRGICVFRYSGRCRGNLTDMAIDTNLSRNGGDRRGYRYSGHRRDGWAAPSHRRVHRRVCLCPAQDICP